MIRGEKIGWQWEKVTEDQLAAGGHEQVEIDKVRIFFGDTLEEFWEIEGVEDTEASLIAGAPELMRLADIVCKDLDTMDRVPADYWELKDLIKKIREGEYGLL